MASHFQSSPLKLRGKDLNERLGNNTDRVLEVAGLRNFFSPDTPSWLPIDLLAPCRWRIILDSALVYQIGLKCTLGASKMRERSAMIPIGKRQARMYLFRLWSLRSFCPSPSRDTYTLTLCKMSCLEVRVTYHSVGKIILCLENGGLSAGVRLYKVAIPIGGKHVASRPKICAQCQSLQYEQPRTIVIQFSR